MADLRGTRFGLRCGMVGDGCVVVMVVAYVYDGIASLVVKSGDV